MYDSIGSFIWIMRVYLPHSGAYGAVLRYVEREAVALEDWWRVIYIFYFDVDYHLQFQSHIKHVLEEEQL